MNFVSCAIINLGLFALIAYAIQYTDSLVPLFGLIFMTGATHKKDGDKKENES